MNQSEYLKKLEGDAQKRYIEKIKLIDNEDPYSIKKSEMSSDKSLFPSITYPDIVNYLLFAPSPVTQEELKAYKSLESYNQFVSGWIKEMYVKSYKTLDRVLIFGRVSCQIFLYLFNL